MTVYTMDNKIHPIYTNYKATIDGRVFNITTNKQLYGSTRSKYINLALIINSKQKHIQLHRFVWECFNGIIEKNYEIDHIDRNGLNNKLKNLQCLSRKDHSAKTSKDNPMSGKKTGETLAHKIIAINLKTNQETIYNSLVHAAENIHKATATKISAVLRDKRNSHQGHTFKYYKIEEDLKGEIWASSFNPLFKGIQISNFGRIKTKRNRMTYGNLHCGYLRISVSQVNIKTCIFVHRLVCEIFNGICPDIKNYTVDHIDHNKLNNNASNLKWSTRKEQSLNRTITKNVAAYDLEGNHVGTWLSITEAAKQTNCCNSNVGRVCSGELKKIKNLVFKFVD